MVKVTTCLNTAKENPTDSNMRYTTEEFATNNYIEHNIPHKLLQSIDKYDPEQYWDEAVEFCSSPYLFAVFQRSNKSSHLMRNVRAKK